MINKYKPINEKLPVFWHGGDYNPDQWLNTPEIIDEDIRLMKLAHVNVVSIGIFSWAQLERKEGEFNFSWLDIVLDKLYQNGIYVILATPSAAQPTWMSIKYPEVIRTDEKRRRNDIGTRVNYCLTSSIYREKCRVIDAKLAERYKDHPALLMWHINNEMSGQCFCENCRKGFREWVREKYKTLDNLNEMWWTAFSSQTLSDWDEVDAPGYIRGSLDNFNDARMLDWTRYMSQMNYECYKNEAKAIKKIIPEAVVTTNTWRVFGEMDFDMFTDGMDVVSYDAYPQYQDQTDDWKIAQSFSFVFDMYRSMKGGMPFIMMESTPASAFMFTALKAKRPGIHKMASLQAIAHGSDTVLYFQWRKGRGGGEKAHGAVVDHVGHENNRVFQYVSELGAELEKLAPIIGTTKNAEVAVIYDPQILWLMGIDGHYHKNKQAYQWECVKHYNTFWDKGISVDVIHPNSDISKYKLVIAPMLYMLRDGFDAKIKSFVENGGNFVTTYLSGIVDEADLCFINGYPGRLKELLGIWSEELDVLNDGEHIYSKWVEDLPQVRRKGTVIIECIPGNPLKLNKEYEASTFCDIIHLEGACPIAVYGGEFYQGSPCLTVNNYGKGKAYYVASKNGREFYTDFYSSIISDLEICSNVKTELPEGVTVQARSDGEKTYLFVINCTPDAQEIELGINSFDMINECQSDGKLELGAYDVRVLCVSN